MTIANFSQEDIQRILSEHLTPSAAIRTPERLFGRQKNLTAIARALGSTGRQIFIYGDRGVGKTSLALTAAGLHTASDQVPIYVPAGKSSTFSSVIQAVGHGAVSIVDRMEKPSTGGGLNFNLPAIGGAGYSRATPATVTIPEPQTVSEALDVIRYVSERKPGALVIVIDELERMEASAEREKLAEFIKNVPEIDDTKRFIFCGIATDINEMLEFHPSAGRILETIKLERLHHSDLWNILTVVATKLGVQVDMETLVRISQISDGFPHFVHLIGESMFWSMFDAVGEISETRIEDFRCGIKGAIDRTEAILRAQYDKATKKTKNTHEYEEALWALADTTSDRRQLSEVYESSYRRIMSAGALASRPLLSREKFNQRLLSLKKDAHGRIVMGYGSGWFGFRENMMRGYVRLRAEEQDIQLGRDRR